jgi:hypothetical protein
VKAVRLNLNGKSREQGHYGHICSSSACCGDRVGGSKLHARDLFLILFANLYKADIDDFKKVT